MITVDSLLAGVPSLPERDLERWISNYWVKPDGDPADYLLHEIDVARVRLILELRDDLDVNETAFPIVLLLIDQIYDLGRQILASNPAKGAM